MKPQQIPGPGEFFRNAYQVLPRRRFWISVLGGTLIGVSICGFIYFLATRTKGLAHDSLITLLMLAFCWIFLSVGLRQLWSCYKQRTLKGVAAALIAVAVPSLLISSTLHLAAALYQIRRMQAQNVLAVRIGTTLVRDPAAIKTIVECFHRTQWSQESRGFNPRIPFFITYRDGHEDRYWIASDLSYDRVVVQIGEGERGMSRDYGTLAVPQLSQELEKRGIWRTVDLYHVAKFRHILSVTVGIPEAPLSQADR